MSNPTVTIKTGRIEGIQKGSISVFKGIPYAKPPVGDLRWRPPQPAEPWEGTLKADKFGPVAYQRGGELIEFVYNLIKKQGMGWLKEKALLGLAKYGPRPKQSEDCLKLIVRTPSLSPADKLPVMVFIHGGGHQEGSAADILYESNALSKKDVVLVLINYRLGLFGNFAHPDLSAESEHDVSGNYGMLDQILGLEWVQENIAQFGGDPENVTIFGESAGGESVLHLMCSPQAEGLFHKAISQSAGTGGQLSHLRKPFSSYPSAEEQGIGFARLTGASSVAEMRNMPADELMKIVRANDGINGNFFPVIDGHYLPKSIANSFQDGDQIDVPLMIGSNEHEYTLFHPIFDTVLIEYLDEDHEPGKLPEYMQAEFGDDLPELCKLYPNLEKRDTKAVEEFQGDIFFGAPTRFYAGEMVAAPEPVFFYQFRRKSPLKKESAGAFHAAELPFVFGALKSPMFPSNQKDEELAEIMQGYWTNFAKTGNPNGENLPNWSEFTDVAPYWMVFDREDVGVRPVEIEANYQIFMRRIQRQVDQMREGYAQEAIPASGD